MGQVQWLSWRTESGHPEQELGLWGNLASMDSSKTWACGKLSLPCMGKTRSLVPAMRAVRLDLGVSTQGSDQVQPLRRVWEPQIEGVVAPITSLCAALGR